VVFAQEMLRVSGSMRDLASQMKLERTQRLAEAERLHQAWTGADPRKRKWGLGLLARGGAKQEEAEQRQKDQQDVVASCLESVMEQMEKVRLHGRRCVGDAVIQSRVHAKTLGERLSLLRSRWRGGLHKEGQQSSTMVRLLENVVSALEAAPEATQDTQESELLEPASAAPELRAAEAEAAATGEPAVASSAEVQAGPADDAEDGPVEEEVWPDRSSLSCQTSPAPPCVSDLKDSCRDEEAPAATTILQANAETSDEAAEVDSRQASDDEGAKLMNENCTSCTMVDGSVHDENAEAETNEPEELAGPAESAEPEGEVREELAEAEADERADKVDTSKLEEHPAQERSAEPEAPAPTELAEQVAPAASEEPVAVQKETEDIPEVQTDVQHQEAKVDLDEELRICEQQLLELEQKRARARSMRRSASRDSLQQGEEDSATLFASSADEKKDGHQLSRRLSELAGHALESSCDHRTGAMEVFNHANALLERLAAVMHSHSFGDPEEENLQDDVSEQDRL